MFQLLFLRLHCVYIPPEDLHQYSIDEFLWMLLIAIIDLVSTVHAFHERFKT